MNALSMVRRMAAAHPVLAAFAGYSALSVVLTWPLAAGIGSRVPLGDNDLWQNYWNAWWWQRCAESFSSPFHTDLLFHPTGADLGWHTHSPANVIAALPAAWIARSLGLDGPAAALSVATLAGFVLAALGAHLLAREHTGGGWPPVLAGIVFGYFPQHVEQSLEHLNLASYWAMPFSLLFLGRAARGGGPRAWVPAGLFLGLNALLSWHNVLLFFLPAAAVLIAELRRAPARGRALAGVAAAAAITAVIMLPFLWPMLAEAARGAGGFKEAVHKPIDPLFLVVPQPGHPIWGEGLAPLYARFRTYPSAGFVCYVGIAALSLSAAAWTWRGRRRPPAPAPGGSPAEMPPTGWPNARWAALFWSALFLANVVLALGRAPRIGGMDFPSIPLPFGIIDELPLLGAVRVANRFMVPAMLCLAMLAALGGAALADYLRRPRLAGAALAGLAGVLILDFLWLPYPLREIPQPAWLAALERQPAGLAVLDIPTGAGPRAAEDMLNQTRHGRPLAGGYVSRTPPAIQKTLEEHPALKQVFFAHPPPAPPRAETLSEAILAIDVGIVVVHLDRASERLEVERSRTLAEAPADLYRARLFNPEKGLPEADLARIRRELSGRFGPPVYADAGVEIYLTKR